MRPLLHSCHGVFSVVAELEWLFNQLRNTGNHVRRVTASNSQGDRCLDIGGLPLAGSHGRAKWQACLRYFDKSALGRQNHSGVIAVRWRCAVR